MYKVTCTSHKNDKVHRSTKNLAIPLRRCISFCGTLSKKIKTYARVKAAVENKIESGLKAKKAVFETDAELGGLENMENQSSVPRRSYGYEFARSQRKLLKDEDPLKKLLIKQKEEVRTGKRIIRKISFDGDSYTVVLFSDTSVNNIANFC